MKLIRSKTGQTTVEYILLLVVVVFLIRGVLSKVEDFFLDGDDSFLSRFTEGNNHFTGNFKTFTLRK